MRIRRRGRSGIGGGIGAAPQGRQQDGNNPGEEDAVEGAGAADGGDGRAEALNFAEVQEIGPDERAEGAADERQGGAGASRGSWR